MEIKEIEDCYVEDIYINGLRLAGGCDMYELMELEFYGVYRKIRINKETALSIVDHISKVFDI